MPKALAILLMLVFAGDMALPALFADPESSLPACCRRDGKHHCAMMDMVEQQDDSAGPVVKSVQQRCPYFPRGGGAQLNAQAAVIDPGPVFYAGLTSHPAVHAQTEARFRFSFSRSTQKRGPPELFV